MSGYRQWELVDTKDNEQTATIYRYDGKVQMIVLKNRYDTIFGLDELCGVLNSVYLEMGYDRQFFEVEKTMLVFKTNSETRLDLKLPAVGALFNVSKAMRVVQYSYALHCQERETKEKYKDKTIADVFMLMEQLDRKLDRLLKAKR